MEFSWGHAAQVALVGFAGVFAILTILQIGVSITNKLVKWFGPKPGTEEKRKG